MLPWKLRKRQILPVNQNLSSVYFSLAKFQLVSCNLSLAMIWQMTYSQTAKTVSLGSFDTTIICMCEKPRHNNGIRRRNPTYLEDVENLGTRLKDLQPKRLCLSLAAHLQSSLSLFDDHECQSVRIKIAMLVVNLCVMHMGIILWTPS